MTAYPLARVVDAEPNTSTAVSVTVECPGDCQGHPTLHHHGVPTAEAPELLDGIDTYGHRAAHCHNGTNGYILADPAGLVRLAVTTSKGIAR